LGGGAGASNRIQSIDYPSSLTYRDTHTHLIQQASSSPLRVADPSPSLSEAFASPSFDLPVVEMEKGFDDPIVESINNTT